MEHAENEVLHTKEERGMKMKFNIRLLNRYLKQGCHHLKCNNWLEANQRLKECY